jgi:hypothetical protein
MRKVVGLVQVQSGGLILVVQHRRQQRRTSSSGSTFFWAVAAVIAVALIVGNGPSKTPAAPQRPVASNNPRQLAAEVLKLKNDIVLNATTRSALAAYARTGVLKNFCGDTPFQLDPLLLRLLLQLQQRGYRVLVNNIGIGSDRARRWCYDRHGNRTRDQHVRGRGIDLNGIAKKGGPRTNWGDIQFRSGVEMRAVQGYTDAWLALLPRNRGGVGQEGCLNGAYRRGGFHVRIPPGSKNENYASFTDGCDHLHLDVRVR